MNNNNESLFNHEAIEKQVIKEIKERYKNDIKLSFLMQVRAQVKETLSLEMFSLLQNELKFSLLDNPNANIEVKICNLIIGAHNSYVFALSDEERGKLQNSTAYRKALSNIVCDELRLKNFGIDLFSQRNAPLKEQFLYYPLPYMCHVLAYDMQRYPIKHKHYTIMMILNRLYGAIRLFECGSYDMCLAICRTIIEEMFRLCIFQKTNDDVYTAYTKFLVYITYYEKTEIYMDEFKQCFENRKNQDCKDKRLYLNYGWLDSIANYHDIVKRNPYSFTGLKQYLKKVSSELEKPTLDSLNRFYKYTCGFVHGSNFYRPEDLTSYYINISAILSVATGMVLNHMLKYENYNPILNNVNLADAFHRSLDGLNDAIKKMS